VQDLGWSVDSSILVSVGLDSRIVVWSGHSFEKLKTISTHNSHVKGITFDPANKYFATASDDRSIKIFRYTPPAPNTTAHDQTNNFMLEATITQPFVASPLTTYFRRCSWSPDGNSVAAANAVNGQVSTAAVLERGTWNAGISLIGHEAPIEVCAFSPRIFSKTAPGKVDANGNPAIPAITTVLACAGQDRSLSIWDTSHTHPVYAFENLATKSISDLAWCPDGESVFFTSLDGTITFAQFAKGELGYPVSLDYNAAALARYGAGRKVGVIEGPEGLVLEERSKNDELRNVQGRMGELMGDAAQAGARPASASEILGTTNDKPSTTNGQPKATTNGATPAAAASTEDTNAARVEKLKQRVTITKDGKKRVAPILISSAAAPNQSTLPQSQLLSSVQRNSADTAPQTILDLSKPFDGLPKGGLSSLLFGNKRKLAETGAEDDNAIGTRVAQTQREGATSVLVNTTEGLALPSQAVTPQDRPSLVNPGIAMSQIRLAVPTIRGLISRPLGRGTRDTGAEPESSKPLPVVDLPILEVRNPTGPSRIARQQDRDPARITVTKKSQLLWQDFLPKAVSLVTGNSRFWAATCEDGSLYVWSPAGRRIFNAFALEAQTAILDCRGPWLLSVTAVGICHVWNIDQASAPYPPVSLAPVLDMAAQSQGPHLTQGPAIIFARLNSEGRVIVAMSNGDAYAYSPTMFVWQRLSEAWWAVGSQYWNTSTTSQSSSSRAADAEENDIVRTENISAGIIPLLERNTTSQTLLRGRAYFLQRLVKTLLSAEGYEGFESGVSVAHLENRLAAALTLGAKEEFKVYLSMYAKRLGAESSRLKIEELLRNLLQGVHEQGGGAGMVDPEAKSDELCGWKKEVLLREVVLILGELGQIFHCLHIADQIPGKYRDLQRITVTYARLLGITNETEDDSEMVVDA